MEEKKKASRKKTKREKKEGKQKRKAGPSNLIEDSIGNPEHDVLLNEDQNKNDRQHKSQLGPESHFKRKMTKQSTLKD